jgi:hypothetical protein
MDDAHPLDVWIKENSTRSDFARDVECSESHLINIIARRKRPSLDLLTRIKTCTDGAIDLESFPPHPEEVD